MTSNTTSYKWAKFKNGLSSIAIITLEVEQNSSAKNQIIENYSGQGFSNQGHIEEVPENGYDSWKTGARKGLEYAFSLIDTYWIVTINKIEGLSTDTNPTIVGYTVLRAFFDKIDHQLSEKRIEILEDFVLSSWAKSYKEFIPDFFNLSFTEYKS